MSHYSPGVIVVHNVIMIPTIMETAVQWEGITVKKKKKVIIIKHKV